MEYRRIEERDDRAVASIIRKNLEHYHLDIPGTAYFDEKLDSLSSYYNEEGRKRIYYVVIDDGKVSGGVGVAEMDGYPGRAEIQKLYLDDSAKGKGYGRALMEKAEEWAVRNGMKELYLETHSALFAAVALYEKLGWKRMERPSSTVHSTMDTFFLKRLDNE